MFNAMLVDDEKGVRNGIKAKIDWEAAGFTVALEASSGSEALQLLERHPLPDLIISDIRMPQMNGIELIRICKERYPRLKIVVLSGYSDFEYLKAAIQLGVKDYVLKPVVRGELMELLRRLAAELGEERELRQAEERESLQQSQQLKLVQEQLLLQLVKDQWYSLAAVKERLCQVKLSPLAEEGLTAQFAAVELVIPAGRLAGGERRDLFYLAFQMLCRETADQWEQVYPFHDIANSAMMYFLIVHSGRTGGRAAVRFVEELDRNIRTFLKLECICGIGTEIGGLKEWKNGYSSCMLSWSRSTVHKTELGGPGPGLAVLDAFSPEMERKMVQAIENADMNGFRSLMNAVLSTGGETAPMFAFTLLALRLILMLGAVAKQFGSGDSSLQQYLWSCQMTIRDYQSREQATRQICELAGLVMEEVKKTRFSSGQPIIEAVKMYVDENFCYELNLSSLAEMFHLNETYLSSLFKQRTGVTFSDYVTNLRIGKATQLLRENELKLTDIAMLVGYSSSSYFSTAFKKSLGVSPKEYRREYLENTGAPKDAGP